MSKSYYCKEIKEKEICGETDPDKFPKGRYSTCKECRNFFVRDYNRKLKTEEKIVKKMEITDKISENRGELGKNIHDLIVHILETYPLNGIGIALPVKIEDIETVAIQDYTRNKDRIEDIEKDLIKEIKHLKQENTNLKHELFELKKVLINKNILIFED
jgi:hypothetical protein